MIRRLYKLHWRRHIAVSMVLGLLAFVILEANTACVRDMISMEIYGTKPHRIPCSKWPTLDEVEQVVDQHARVVRRVEDVAEAGSILISIDTSSKCPGKAVIIIYYSANRYLESIREIIGDEKYFFGVPYSLKNW